jgi:predicted AlkP superfamily phosphohydrolase/phosphomutase
MFDRAGRKVVMVSGMARPGNSVTERGQCRMVRMVLVAGLLVVGLADASPAMAYIGPGAGIALLGSLWVMVAAMASAVLFLFTWPIRWVWRSIRWRKAFSRAKVKRVVMVGLDGLEPTLAERYLAEGWLPNLAKLKEQGMYMRLGTSCPPLSPVAWSCFSTGVNPGKHNIYDFLNRNPLSYLPTLSSVRIGDVKRKVRIGKYQLPLGKAELRGLRKSKPFWTVLGEHGIFSCVQRVPIMFPPDRFRGVQLSAMCVPDLLGSQGTFSFYSSYEDEGPYEVGGQRFKVTRNNGYVESHLVGPENFIRPDEKAMKVPFRVVTNGSDQDATLEVDGQRIRLERGKFTEWTEVTFKAGLGIKARGVCRFFLKQIKPEFELYVTPIQIDPDKPVLPISHPRVYATYLSKLLGKYATLGLAEDTWSLNSGVMSEDAFLEHSYSIHEERERMFFDGLKRVRHGFLGCVFDGPDRIQHMFWRFLDDRHPACRGKDRSQHEHAIRDMYVRMDGLVGRVMKELEGDKDTLLIVMSDHGFKPFRRGIDLNRWLEENGYLAVKQGEGHKQYLAGIDWSKTRAYAIGLSGIFINEKGRESRGIVSSGPEREGLVNELVEKLTGLRDPENGASGIRRVMTREKVYHGPYVKQAPDLIIGYEEGYRVSWDAAVGRVTDKVFHDNTKAWSGDHCIDPEVVPGVFFSSRKFNAAGANIIDVAPTVLELFGVDRPRFLDGKSLVCSET